MEAYNIEKPAGARKLSRVEELDVKLAEINAIFTGAAIEHEAKLESLNNVQDTREAILKSFDLNGVVEHIIGCSHVIVIVGALLPDTSDFSDEIQLNLNKCNVSSINDIFTEQFYLNNRQTFFTILRQLFKSNSKTTSIHRFIELLNEKQKLLRVYNQSIDSLQKLTDIGSDKIIDRNEILSSALCSNCSTQFCFNEFKNALTNEQTASCKECSGSIVPEMVAATQISYPLVTESFEKDLEQCDFLIIFGSIISISSLNMLISKVNDNCPRCLINTEPNLYIQSNDISSKNTFKFDEKNNYRDVYYRNYLNDAVHEMIKLLNWESEYGKTFVCDNTPAPVVTSIKPKSVNITTRRVSLATSSTTRTSPRKSPPRNNNRSPQRSPTRKATLTQVHTSKPKSTSVKATATKKR